MIKEYGLMTAPEKEGPGKTKEDLVSVKDEDCSDTDPREKKEKTLVPDDELAKLLETTNFSKREIVDFYTRKDVNDKNDDGFLDYSEFAGLCEDSGLKNEGLVKRLWKFVDNDNSGRITKFELVQGVAPLVRGTIEDVASMFQYIRCG
jgi:Ca2+-binding EF-hand superfamily protein